MTITNLKCEECGLVFGAEHLKQRFTSRSGLIHFLSRIKKGGLIFCSSKCGYTFKGRKRISWDVEEAFELYVTGKYYLRELSEIYGVTPQNIWLRFGDRGLREKREYTDTARTFGRSGGMRGKMKAADKLKEKIPKEYLLSLYTKQTSIIDLAKKLSITIKQINKLMKEYEIEKHSALKYTYPYTQEGWICKRCGKQIYVNNVYEKIKVDKNIYYGVNIFCLEHIRNYRIPKCLECGKELTGLVQDRSKKGIASGACSLKCSPKVNRLLSRLSRMKATKARYIDPDSYEIIVAIAKADIAIVDKSSEVRYDRSSQATAEVVRTDAGRSQEA